MAELRDYVQHKPDCELVLYCALCSSHRDGFHEHLFVSMADTDPEQSGCTCGLRELLTPAPQPSVTDGPEAFSRAIESSNTSNYCESCGTRHALTNDPRLCGAVQGSLGEYE